VDETGGSFAERVGNDEIALAGFGIDATGKTVMLPSFTVYSHFDDGDVKKFSPPKTILMLDVPDEGMFPKKCVASLILAEKDTGGLEELAREGLTKLDEQIGLKKQQMMGSGVAPLDIDWEEVWDTVRPILYGYIKDKITRGLDDDVFPPQDVSVEISSADFHWGDGTKLSPEETVVFRGHGGVYHLTYYWEIKTV
jgi:hypothetical protein